VNSRGKIAGGTIPHALDSVVAEAVHLGEDDPVILKVAKPFSAAEEWRLSTLSGPSAISLKPSKSPSRYSGYQSQLLTDPFCVKLDDA
jgi:hypothetical protein